MVRKRLLAAQVARADLILAQLLHHGLVEDGFLLFAQNSVLEPELTLVLLHRLGLFLYGSLLVRPLTSMQHAHRRKIALGG